MMKNFWFWLRYNSSSAHLRFMAKILRRNGWVVFYLKDVYWPCSAINNPNGVCWLKEYQNSIQNETQ